ncbi:G-protein coupled receptor GRL101-like [Saccostrea echinata]|uniref:G-protein coupled receptor GRL101-like n=1 Tax=Saccostrea echinata TaxID=191078 RepID=UPI002A80DED6|nr:G-protein coupled receptor GRL101-like [Saccostrea echinata]
MEVSSYTICCAKPNSIYNVKCIAPVNEISSCENLIADPVLSAAVWYIALMAIFGNMTVFLHFASNFKSNEEGAYYILTINLSCAEFLVGVYLYIIAIINLHYTGQYGLNDYVWRHSIVCTLSGITATLSSEVSAFIVLLITLDRFIAVMYPFSDLKLNRRRVSVLLFIVWVASLLLALIPLIPDPNLENFYAQSGVCVSLPLSITRKSGWQYSMTVFVGINFSLFLFIIFVQISIFVKVFRVGKNVQSTAESQRESSLAKTLFAIVLTDVFCWIPIGTIGMLTFFGIEVQPYVYAWMIVAVLPINSAINPILYLLTIFIRNKWRSVNTSQRVISTVSGTSSYSRDLQHCPVDQKQGTTKKIVNIKEEGIGSQEKMESLQERIGIQMEGIGSHQERMESVEEKIATQEERIGSQKRVEFLEERIGTHQERMESIQDRIGTQGVGIGSQQERMESLQERIGSQQERIGPHQEGIGSQQEMFRKHQDPERIGTQQERFVSTQERLRSQQERISTPQERIGSYQEEMESL